MNDSNRNSVAVGGGFEYKISVLIPLYNRKHYIEQCIDSALNQTFQDFEIIVRDDGSTDGSADFVAERYAAEISLGKIKLRRNEKNIGQFATDDKLTLDARGKYIAFLHSDDLYVPHALQHMYEVAEHFQADVVHASRLFSSGLDGVIENGKPLYLACWESNPVNEIKLMPADAESRFKEWADGGTFSDKPHNFYRREFILENEIFSALSATPSTFFLRWLMEARVYVKTPMPIYIYRRAPDSKTFVKYIPPEKIADVIHRAVDDLCYLDKFFAETDFFKDNEEAKYIARTKIFSGEISWWVQRVGHYRQGVYPELNRAVESAFRKYFGENAAYPTFLFHYLCCQLCGQKVDKMTESPPRQEDKSLKFYF